MLPIFIYILKAILVSGILLGYYWISLRNTRFHYYNRFYLVGTVLLSLCLPLLDLQWFTINAPAAEPVQQVVQFIYHPQALAPVQTSLGWEQILTIALFSISALLVCFFFLGIWKVVLIKAKGKITKMERFDFVETISEDAPFSFFRNLFWRKDLPVQDQTGQRMLKHELTHIEQHHSFDKLFISLATFIFWMNPFFWLIRKELEVVHEFIADEEAIAGGDAEELAEMLLKAHYHSNILSVGQSFFYSSIKRRIIMLTSSKKVSYSYARRLLILPVAIGVLALLSFSIKDSLENSAGMKSNQEAITVAHRDTVPAKYRDPKTGKIKGSFQIDIDGDMASFKDIKTKKELFKLPLNELSGPDNKVITVQGFPMNVDKKVTIITSDSVSKPEFVVISDGKGMPSMPANGAGKKGIPKIIINGKEISPGEIDKIDPTSIKTIDIRGDENVAAIAGAPVQRKVYIQTIKGDTTEVKTVSGYKLKSDSKTVVVTTTDTSIASAAVKDPRTLTITVRGSDGDTKKSYTIVRKETENSDLPKDLLYIIDGKELSSGSMKDIDPTTIQSINVLKGESAVKKYGEKGKNGVVEITSKKN